MRFKFTGLINLSLVFSFLLMTAVFVSCKDEGEDNLLPGPAGVILGDEQGEKSVTLTIAEINLATAYKWYRDGAEVQNSTSRTYTVTRSGVYKVAGVNEFGEGEASPEKRVTITDPTEDPELPAAAAEITGEDSGEESVTLSVNEIERAETYKWYRDGSEVQNTSSRTYLATQSGRYKVAGVNKKGEGEASPEKIVTITGGYDDPNLPAPAPQIFGGSQGRERVPLIIEQIERAESYKWYRDGVEIDHPGLYAAVALETGAYTVAGVNSYGEGKPSPAKHVTIGEVIFTEWPEVSGRYFGDERDTNTGLFVLDFSRPDGIYKDCMTIEGFIPLGVDPVNITIPDGRYELKTLFDFTDQPFVLHPGAANILGPYGSYWYVLDRDEERLDISFCYAGFMEVSRTGNEYTITIEFEAQTSYMIAEYFYYTYTGEIVFENLAEKVDQTTFTTLIDAEYYGKSNGTQNDQFLINLMDGASFPLYNFTVLGHTGTNGFDNFEIPSGTYTISDRDEPFALEPGGISGAYLLPTCYTYFETQFSGSNVFLTGGTMEVENKGNNLYKLIINMEGSNVHTGEEHRLMATYEGTIVFKDESEDDEAVRIGPNAYAPYRLPVLK